jgi:DNA-binding MltR family transcriptional regulator
MNKSSINDLLLSMFESILEVKNIDQSKMFEDVVAKTLKNNNLDDLIGVETEDVFKFQFIILRETDRGVALMAAAYLENSLEGLLKKLFVNDSFLKNDPFNSYNGFLTTFSSKIDLAFMLGLISNKTKQKLNWIRSIRNDFAHSADFINFDEQSFADRCNNLNDYEKTEDLSPRDIFIDAVFELSGIIYTTRLDLDERREKKDQESGQFDLRKLIPDFEEEFLRELKDYLENDE